MIVNGRAAEDVDKSMTYRLGNIVKSPPGIGGLDSRKDGE